MANRATLIGLVYDNIELGLWAALIAGIAVFALFVVPGLPAAQRRAEAARLAAFDHACEFYCRRWGMSAGTRAHAQCMSDLRQFRASLEKDFAESAF